MLSTTNRTVNITVTIKQGTHLSICNRCRVSNINRSNVWSGSELSTWTYDESGGLRPARNDRPEETTNKPIYRNTKNVQISRLSNKPY